MGLSSTCYPKSRGVEEDGPGEVSPPSRETNVAQPPTLGRCLENERLYKQHK